LSVDSISEKFSFTQSKTGTNLSLLIALFYAMLYTRGITAVKRYSCTLLITAAEIFLCALLIAAI
jgi:hypothetical protein